MVNKTISGDLFKLNVRYCKSTSLQCFLGNTNKTDDLFHFLAVCTVLTEVRKRWLKTDLLDGGEVIEDG